MKNPRASLAKALKKLRPQSADLVMECVDRLIEEMSTYGFHLTGKPSDGTDPFWHYLLFERVHSPQAFEFICVSLSSDGLPSFACFFGVKGYGDTDEWHLRGNLSKRGLIFRTYNLGASYTLPFKEQKFARDWRFLMASIDKIVSFLETGKGSRNISDAEVFAPFQPRQAGQDGPDA